MTLTHWTSVWRTLKRSAAALPAVGAVLGVALAAGSTERPDVDRTAEAVARITGGDLGGKGLSALQARLTPSQLLFIARKGREAGCHALMNFFDHECGYESRPVDREAQRDRVVEVISESTKMLAAALATLERLK